jgi:galactosylceramidase
MPYTILGDSAWTDYAVSADVLLTGHGGAGLLGRINETGTGYGTVPKAYALRLLADGTCSLVVINGEAGEQELGDLEHQARLRAEAAAGHTGERGEKSVGRVVLPHFDATKWHTLKLAFAGSSITGYVDGEKVIAATNTLFSHGLVGLLAVDHPDRSTPYFANLTIAPIDAAPPAPPPASPAVRPIY